MKAAHSDLHTLTLRSADPQSIRAALKSDAALGRYLNALITPAWHSDVKTLTYTLHQLQKGAGQANWWLYFPILKSENRLIGNGGYKGAPDEKGVVEIGYEIAPAYRGRGLATVFAKNLLSKAFMDSKVCSVIAHTNIQHEASIRVLEKCGMQKTEEEVLPGVLRFEYKRRDSQ